MGSVQVLDVQRARILAAMVQVVAEDGGAGSVTVARVVARAGVSRRTFYDLFDGCEDCFLAVFEDALTRATQVANDAVASASPVWREQVRAGLAALLALFDEEPALGSLLVVDALAAGPEVLERRARALESLAAIVARGASTAKGKGGASDEQSSPPLAAEGVVGAVLSVVHARMLERRRRHARATNGSGANGYARSGSEHEPLIELLNPLMSVIVLPYLGQAVARRELDHPTPRTSSPRDAPGSPRGTPKPPTSANPLAGLNMRITYRTLQVLATIAQAPGASNRQIADGAGVHDQGQISKLLTRLERLGLVHNTGLGQAKGEPNAWTLTPQGRQVEQALTVGR